MDALPNTVTALVERNGAEIASHAEDGRLDLQSGDRLDLSFRLLHAEHATFVVSGLPPGARAESAQDGVDVVWTPSDSDAGRHELHVHAVDGPSTADRAFDIYVDASGAAYMAPGARLVVWAPNASDALGAFVGAGAQVMLLGWAQQGHRWWPSHGRLYLHGDVLGSPRVSKPAFDVGLGFDFSLERSPARRFLIPFVGAEAGVTFAEFSGTFGWAMPRAGIYVWNTRALRIEVDGGYMLPTTATQDVRGPRFAASVDLAPW